MNEELLSLSKQISALLKGKGLKLKTAESFTGGTVASAVVMTAGASEYFDEGLVCYSWDAKMHRLGVKKCDLEGFGAVSLPVIRAMLQGLLDSGADIAAATTGDAGPLIQTDIDGINGNITGNITDETKNNMTDNMTDNMTGNMTDSKAAECYVGAATRTRMAIKKLLFKSGDEKTRQEIIMRGAAETLKSIIELIKETG